MNVGFRNTLFLIIERSAKILMNFITCRFYDDGPVLLCSVVLPLYCLPIFLVRLLV